MDEIGGDPSFSDWGRADSREALFDFDEFGSVKIRGSPDGAFRGLPVELKTVVSSIEDGASTWKIRSYSLQVASYQKTHGTNSTITPAILIIVSIKDGHVLALELPPSNYKRAMTAWKRNLTVAYGGVYGFGRRYWDEVSGSECEAGMSVATT